MLQQADKTAVANRRRHQILDDVENAEALDRGCREQVVEAASCNQPGDPKLLATQIVALCSQGEAPSRLVFGDDARQWAGAKVGQLRQEIARSADRG
jgi:hypothetical protein